MRIRYLADGEDTELGKAIKNFDYEGFAQKVQASAEEYRRMPEPKLGEIAEIAWPGHAGLKRLPIDDIINGGTEIVVGEHGCICKLAIADMCLTEEGYWREKVD